MSGGGSVRSMREVVEAMYGRAAADDEEGMIALLAPGFELDVRANVFNPAVWHGPDGARQWLRETREVWDAPSYRVVSIEELDEDHALSEIVLHGTARLSGVMMDVHQWHVWTIRDGLVVRCAHYNDADSARRAAGLAA